MKKRATCICIIACAHARNYDYERMKHWLEQECLAERTRKFARIENEISFRGKK